MDVDQTMRSLLTVHRAEVGDRDQEIAELKARVADLEYQADFRDDAIDRLTEARDNSAEKAKVLWSETERLRGVIESLKIELANARAAATAARDSED